jgi:hypothetical protein
MRSPTEKLNHELKKRGFGGLDDPTIVQQLAVVVRDHVHFRQILMAVVPEERTNCYETMRPHLRFEAWPLDRYVAKAAELAANKELDKAAIDILAEQALARNQRDIDTLGVLALVCTRCTTEDTFKGATLHVALKAAAKAGWGKAFDYRNKKTLTYCPKCAKARIQLVQ